MHARESFLAVTTAVCLLTGQPFQGEPRGGPASPDLPGPAYHAIYDGPRAPEWTHATAKVDLPAPALPAPGSFELVGHDPLMSRGMNAALAVYGNYAYVGSRTDGSHLNSGVMVVDVSTPSAPKIVHEIGAPNEANIGESSRELRILPKENLLLVLNHGCSELIHRCINTTQAGVNLVTSNISFYDISGANGANPKLVAKYLPSRTEPQTPHEFFIWSDPKEPGRTLLYETAPSTDASGRQNLYVVDLSRAREGKFPEIGTWTTRIGNTERDNRLHSLTVSHDGKQAFLAYLGGGFLVADVSDFAENRPDPKVDLVTPIGKRVFWTDPGAHSAVQIPGRTWVMTTDEVYGKLGGVLAAHGCPWGWTRFIDISDPAAPRIASEYRLPSNDPKVCESVGADRDNLSSFSSHNPTLTPNLALVTWHSAGLQAIDIADPAAPKPAAGYLPDPLPFVQTEDPALSSGPDKVVMWSFPIVKDGLVYAVDLRNGLYVFRYHGPHEEEVSASKFLDGNSNSGDIARFNPAIKANRKPSPGGTCLARPRIGTSALGPFALGASKAAAALRAGPAFVVRGNVGSACIQGGGKAVVVFAGKQPKVVLAATTAPRVKAPRGTRGFARRGNRLYRVSGGKLRWVAVTSLRSGRPLRAALKAAGLR
jgi:hypothetical protein